MRVDTACAVEPNAPLSGALNGHCPNGTWLEVDRRGDRKRLPLAVVRCPSMSCRNRPRSAPGEYRREETRCTGRLGELQMRHSPDRSQPGEAPSGRRRKPEPVRVDTSALPSMRKPSRRWASVWRRRRLAVGTVPLGPGVGDADRARARGSQRFLPSACSGRTSRSAASS